MDQTHTKIWILFQFTSGPWRPILGKKSTISCKLGPPEAKLWYRIFFIMKMEECMKSEHSRIFRVKLVAKNKVFGSSKTQPQAISVVRTLSEEQYKCCKPGG